MARKSHLTDDQKQEILKRSLQGETPYAIGKAMKLPETTVRRHTGASSTIKDATNQILAAERKISSLSIPAQVVAYDVLAGLRAISGNVIQAAVIGSGNAVRLHSMAAVQLDKSTRADPDNPDIESIKVAAGMTKAANEAAQAGMQLLQVNKGVTVPGDTDNAPEVKELSPAEAAKAYAAFIGR